MSKTFKNAVEIGAGDSYSSILLRFADAERVTLYEPNPILFEDLKKHVYPNGVFPWSTPLEPIPPIVAIPCAIVSPEHIGMKADLVKMGYASYLAGFPSFMSLSLEGESDACWRPLMGEVPCLRIGQIDDGTIDFLAITIGGGEHLILNHVKSRPKIILTKFYCHNTGHWEHANKTMNTLNSWGYRPELLERNEHSTYHYLRWNL